MYTTCPLSPPYELTVHPTHLGLQDEMKINNNLQIQLQSEKQERKIEGLERRFELKLDELAKKHKTNQDQLSAQQKDIQEVQVQLIASQDQIF